MLMGIMFMLMSLVLLVPTSRSWYTVLWGLGLTSLFTFLFMYSPLWQFCYFSRQLGCDSLSQMLVSLTVWISMLVMFASQEIKNTENAEKQFSAVVVALCLILVLAFTITKSLLFFFFFESSLVPTLLLILGWGYQPERLQAGMYMMLYTLTASMPLLFSLLWSTGILLSADMLLVNSLRVEVFYFVPADWAMPLVLFAFLVKMPMFTVHLWLPKAHVEAPVAGSMVLAALLLKLGGYGIIRMYQYLNPNMEVAMVVLYALTLWGGLLASIICFRQVDFKALIAYSSVGHMALVLVGLFSENYWGWSGASLLMVSHGFCSSALFVLANYAYMKTGTRNLMLVKGTLLYAPIMSVWWFLFSVLNMAAPPSINLMGELFIFVAGFHGSFLYVSIIGLMSFVAAAYSVYLYACTQHGASPKFLAADMGIKSICNTTMTLHWLPANALILKAEMLVWF